MDIFLREGLRDLTSTVGGSGLSVAMTAGAGASGEGHYFDENETDESFKNYLESSKEIDKLRGMRLLLAKLSKGRNIAIFFPNVVKNVSCKSVELKKLVYIYLAHYADFDKACRETALLSINSFQKDLMGSNALIRGMALRVMTSIRVPDILALQLAAVKKCASDSSPYVRKCAAVAISKVEPRNCSCSLRWRICHLS